jgi:hypothetical protein
MSTSRCRCSCNVPGRGRANLRAVECFALLLSALGLACAGSSPPSDVPTEPTVLPGEPPVRPAPGEPRARWEPRAVASFEIFHFESAAEFARDLRPVEVVTLELDQLEAAGGRAISDAAHAQNTRVVCYTSSGYEDWRDDAARFPDDARGGGICRDDACRSTWPGEAWGDIRQASLQAFLGTRADRAVAVGCDGIEFDNMDPAFNTTGLNISVDENLEAALKLAELGHQRGLAVLAKNTGELAARLAPVFDGVFVEECEAFDECDRYLPYRGKLVAIVEYDASCRARDWAACNEQDDYFDEDGR